MVPDDSSRAYGVVMTITPSEANALYSENSVRDYVAAPVLATLTDETEIDAICYNLPADKISGANNEYARQLLKLAAQFDFPETYLDQIQQAAG